MPLFTALPLPSTTNTTTSFVDLLLASVTQVTLVEFAPVTGQITPPNVTLIWKRELHAGYHVTFIPTEGALKCAKDWLSNLKKNVLMKTFPQMSLSKKRQITETQK